MDARKTLEQLKQEWEGCTKCSLGEHRDREGGRLVFGEGARRGILFIGEGPGETEEATGRPFVGRSGQILHFAIDKYRIRDISYITNAVACRSCLQALDGGGQPMTRQVKGVSVPIWRDVKPTREQITACRARLFEQIYLIDPLLIVPLGGEATSALLQDSVSIMSERGEARIVQIPGVLQVPSLTPSGKWRRRVGGVSVMPTVPNMVEYMVLPTLHPAFVARALADRSPFGPGALFLKDIGEAAAIYRRFQVETGAEPEPEPPAASMDDFEEDD